MEIDPIRCYRAVESRDPRFDGRFFTAVRTTGIYCRPVCPARTPNRENVCFFACAAAAEAAGFRPCRRCRPETAPGTPAWDGSRGLVGRAMQLIEDGGLDRMGLDALAERLGVGGRQLRRLFAAHLGASPLAIAQTRRASFARRLLDETDLAVERVAYAAGFGSVRRMNHVFRRSFGHAPRDTRRPLRAMGPSGAPVGLRLAFRPPLDFDAALAFLAARALPGLEEGGPGVWHRLVEAAGEVGVVTLSRERGRDELRLEIEPQLAPALLAITSRARRLFDLDADPQAIAGHLVSDPFLRRAVRARPGLRVPGAWDPFESAVRVVLGQQVSVAAATTVAGRLVRAFGRAAPRRAGGSGRAPGLTHLFPRPEDLAEAKVERIGIPGKRAETVRALARAVASGEPVLEAAPGLEEATERLLRLPGIGPWTAHVIAMRALREPDAFPAGDLGVRRALGSERDETTIARAEGWRPWRAYATMHLWQTAVADGAAAARGRAATRRRTA